MKVIRYILLLLFGFLLTACQNKETPKPAHFRVLSTIQYASAKLTINGKRKQKEVHKTLSLQYGASTDYQQLAPGYYDLTLSVYGKALLKGTYAMGKNGYYTLLATGLLPEKWKINPQSIMYHLKYIFAGEEIESTNKYLPQWTMMRDNYDGSKKSAYIRLVNANPHTAALSVKKDNKSFKSGLAYPMASDMLKLKAGDHQLQISYGKIKIAEKRMNAQPGYIYTAVVSNKKSAKDELAVYILKNPSRTLINAKENMKN